MKALLSCILLIAVPATLLAQDVSLVAQKSSEGEVCIQRGPVNGVLIQRHGKQLAIYGARNESGETPEMVLLTHARRDVVWAAESLVQQGVPAVVPQAEAELFTEPERFWNSLQEKRFHDYAQQSTKLPVRKLPVARMVKDGDVVEWEGLALRVLETPGYTRGSVSFLVEWDGRKIAFTGDLLCEDGKLQDLFSFQDAIPAARIGGYHGWAGRLGEAVVSLNRLAAERPDVIIPARGPLIDDPQAAIDRLLHRIRAVYANYLSVDALRWYFKDEHIRTKAQRVLAPGAEVSWMAMAETSPLPQWVRAIANSRLILSADGAGFQVDCGSQRIVDELQKLQTKGELASIEHVFVTHYHDDHTDALPILVEKFNSQVYACGSLIDVLENPHDYRLPCLTKNPITVTARKAHGDSWRWKEFQLTIFDFPGQTLHHNGLLVQRDGGGAFFFAGDSFTPSGVDDYCLQNRNILKPGQGYFRCLDLVEQLPPGCWLINQHVEPAFRFTAAQVETMRRTLHERIGLLKDLLPHDDPNFGLDETWAVVHPYALRARAGETVHCQVRILNHSPVERIFRTSVRAASGITTASGSPVRIAAGAAGTIDVSLSIPAASTPGLHVMTADVAWETGDLRDWLEALVEVQP